MERLNRLSDCNLVTWVHGLLPQEITQLLTYDLFVDNNPAFSGLHHWENTTDGRSYLKTCHVVWPFHQLHLPVTRRKTTMVLFSANLGDSREEQIGTVCHELGHVLDQRFVSYDGQFRWFNRPIFEPLDEYAASDETEAFAAAFVAWLNDSRYNNGWLVHNREELWRKDPGAINFFDALFGCEGSPIKGLFH